VDKTKLQNLPSGHDGNAYITINGTVQSAFKIAKIGGKMEPKVENKQFLGGTVEQNAVRGLKISGDMSYYQTTPVLIKAVRDYKNGGSFPDITLQYYSNSPEYGRIETVLYGVIPASIFFGVLDDSSSDAQKHDTSFTANDFDLV
jgi:hypothetical protein